MLGSSEGAARMATQIVAARQATQREWAARMATQIDAARQATQRYIVHFASTLQVFALHKQQHCSDAACGKGQRRQRRKYMVKYARMGE